MMITSLYHCYYKTNSTEQFEVIFSKVCKTFNFKLKLTLFPKGARFDFPLNSIRCLGSHAVTLCLS